jgi:glycosyltransferase involved in cell wall biosynthesis
VALSNGHDVNASHETARGGAARVRVATLLSFPPGPGTGLGTFIVGLTEALQKHPGLEHVMIAPDVERGAAGRRGSQLLIALWQMWQLARVKPDVIHTHDHPALLAGAVGYKKLAGHSVRVVFTNHLDPVERRARWKRVALGWLLSHCGTVTLAARDSVPKLELLATPIPGPEVIRVVPGAAVVRVRHKWDPDVMAFGASLGHRGGPVLLQVSNYLYPAKVEGTLRLLDAMVDVSRRFPNVHLILLGTGPLVNGVKEARDRLGLRDVVTIPGKFIEDLSLPAGLSDIHCHITLQDACPISILEAMHAGKPIVASRTGGIPETIEHGVNGLLVENDPHDIASAIIDLLDHPDRARTLGARAQQIAQQRFTWGRVASDFEAIYGLASRHRSEPAGVELVPLGK